MSCGPVYASPVASSIPFDNTGTGFIATDVQAAIIEGVNRNTTIQVSSVATATTASTTDALLTTMSITPTPAQYLAFFNSSMIADAAGQAISASFYVGGTQVPESLRKIAPADGGALSVGTARGIMDVMGIITVTTGQTVEVRWSTSSGTATCGPRTFVLLRVSA